MEPFSDPDEWLFDPLPGHLPPHPPHQPHDPALGLNGHVVELERARRGDLDDDQLDVLDDLFTLLIDSPPPGTTITKDESAEGLALAPALPAAPAPSPLQSAAVATSSPLSSSSQSAQEEDGDGAPPPPDDAAASDNIAKLATKAETTAEQPVRKKKRRKRPKDELDYLRGKVSELEHQLSALRTPESPPPSEVKSDPSREDDAEWEEIALHQRHEAESARATNAQLRSMLEGQLSVAQQLQQALQQHLKMARIEGMDAASSSGAPPPKTADALASPELFEELTAKLDDIYSRVDSVLTSTDFAVSADQERARSSAVKTNDRGTYFEISNAHRLPFPVAAVNRALWRSITLTNSNTVRGWVRRLDDDTFNFGFIEPFISTHMPNVTVTVKSSIRRYIEQTRTATVWSSVIEIEGSMYVRLREDGWGIATPVTPSSSTAKKDASVTEISLMQNVVHVTPEVANAATMEEQRAHVGEMTDLVLGTYRRLVRKVNQTVENLLVADSLGGTS